MDQFAEAVNVLLSPDYSEDTLAEAHQFLEDVKTSGDGWLTCAEGFCSEAFSEHVRFQCLVVLELTVTERYETLDAQQQQSLKELVLNWIGTAESETTAIRNKVAQLLAAIFIYEFPDIWPQFFDDILSLIDVDAPASFDFFFRLLKAIDELVVDRAVTRSEDELARNTNLKDAMRQGANAKLAEAWDHCLRNLAGSYPQVAGLCLEVVALFIAWIDADLVVNEPFMALLFELCQSSRQLRVLSCNCFQAIVSKGMDPDVKTDLIQSLELVQFIEAQFSSMEDDEENEYSIALAKLANQIGVDLVEAVRQLGASQRDPTSSIETLSRVFDTAVGLMQSEWDDVSEEILPFAQEYLHLVKHEHIEDEARLRALLLTVIAKMRFDNDFNYDNQDVDENDFLEFRKNLKVIFDNVWGISESIFLQTCLLFVEDTFTDLPDKLEQRSINFADVELALHVIFLMGETVGRPTFGEADDVSQTMTGVMHLASEGSFGLVESNAVNVKFFEICVRSGAYFKVHPDRLPTVLGAFLGDSGLGSTSTHVRARSSYQFLRFVREHGRTLLYPYLEDILSVLHPLLEFGCEGFDLQDQQWIAETVSQLATSEAVPGHDQRTILEPLIAGLVDKVTEIQTEHFAAATTAEEMLELANAMSYFISLTTSMTKGLASFQKVAGAGLDEILGRALHVYMGCLQIPVHKNVVQGAVRVYLHRMIVCLGEHVLPIMPEALGAILEDGECTTESLMQFIPVICQMITKLKQKVSPLMNDFFIPLTRATFGSIESEQDQADSLQVKRAYFEFLKMITVHNLTDVLLSETNAPHIPEVLGRVLEMSDMSDMKGERILVGVFKQLINSWFAQDSGLEGFTDFVLGEVVPHFFQCVLHSDAEGEEAWYHLLLGEFADVLIAVFRNGGPSFLEYLQTTYFPSVEFPPHEAETILELIERSDTKVLKQGLVGFAKRLRS
eukprot:m.7342 g.7342  ORF g.7342 m.7342 type:complete len:955 (+) comp3951_c0_seq1:376-3240(+)